MKEKAQRGTENTKFKNRLATDKTCSIDEQETTGTLQRSRERNQLHRVKSKCESVARPKEKGSRSFRPFSF